MSKKDVTKPPIEIRRRRLDLPVPTDVRGRYPARLRCEDVAEFGVDLEELLVVVRRAMADERVLDLLYQGLDSKTAGEVLDKIVEILRVEEEEREVAAQEARRRA